MKAEASTASYARGARHERSAECGASVQHHTGTTHDWPLQHSRLVFSSATFTELETRLWKPKFDHYVSIEQRNRLLHDLQAGAVWVDLPEELTAKRWSRDPHDDTFIHTTQQVGEKEPSFPRGLPPRE